MSDTLSFRRARAADLPVLVALLSDDTLGRGREDPSQPPNPAYARAFEAIDRDPNQLLAVAERAGKVVGCMQLSFIPGLSRLGAWRGQIESVRVAAGERGAGTGRAFFEWAIEQCRQHGCALVQLTTDKQRADAQRFYLALGFHATHEGMKLALH
ncbi:GNAT family N-acetyltransferase [Bordetella hinzii]|uniref:GNAT family N-acetyltransferase n=2 Tax=Bordetella hinzii TaxID=103855 RepID=A0AAN1RYT1_9BORD|nr:GNAT family N-acetyltransferase [Bordetella hinzii]AKQ55898.1 aminoalkylphosphonic acid N-acetyltransferase [Bordetella hinzii]AKQ60430.1 aminoalkylphosphonic acid N-acetyltransferase [Bordetella hinzii]AZW18519.1 GNAT family N-acetyltransferase [Bordetella hinzii]KCB25528.1 acetyltransferase (GNAT) domain protein [Bordetella hinzii OH87 BAL007II]KCB28012.1 acetyltransferase (GNAT) domain protein [Bordetella hinzii CA90 BAL1384]